MLEKSMYDEKITRAIEQLKASGQADDPAIKLLIQALQTQSNIIGGDKTTASNISVSGSTGTAIGHNIRMVINQIDLSAEAVAALLDVRSVLGASLGLDPNRYQFGTLIADKTRNFVGREHVFKAIDEFITNEPNGYFIIEGDPGSGMTAVLSEYVRRTGCIAHFNIQAQGINTARHFLENVCTQFIVAYELSYSNLPPNASQDGGFLSNLLDEVSTALGKGERLVIAIGALNDVDLAAHPVGVNILYLPTTLPAGVYFVMTKRVGYLPLVVQTPQHLLDMRSYPVENRKDVEIHLQQRADKRPRLRTWIDKQNLTVARFVSTLADLSESNFMYLHYVLPEIVGGTYQDLNIASLPVGLEGFYEDHWRRMGMADKPLPCTKIRIVYILAEMGRPISRHQIARIAATDEITVQEILDEWDEFLHKQRVNEEVHYSPYHRSFRDFLHRKDVVQAAGVTIQGIHKLIADDLWNDLFG